MSVLVVGMSHNSAPMSVLEQVARDSNGVQKLIAQVQDIDPVREVTVMATCNRIEVYAEVDRFHGSVEGISALLCEPMTGSEQVSNNHLYVHYDDGAVTHLFNVAAGLDSMVLGESQILGQAREALRVGQEIGSIGHTLNTLFQQALRIGKRSHAETAIDRAGPSVVSAGLERAKRALGALEERRVLILGVGSMAAIALNALPDAAQVYVANRTAASAERLAQTYGATPIPIEAVDDVLPEVDLIVSCTGSMEIMITAEQVAKGRSRTDRAWLSSIWHYPTTLTLGLSTWPRSNSFHLRRWLRIFTITRPLPRSTTYAQLLLRSWAPSWWLVVRRRSRPLWWPCAAWQPGWSTGRPNG